MPDGTPHQDYVYRPAVRGKSAPLIMISGPPGTGKTYSALRLARGLAGPGGKICLADTDNGRAEFYADEFTFQHLNLHEPFRPAVFEEAARQAQKQGAAVLVIDNFMHEHNGPGGVLDYHEEVLEKLTRGDISKRESLNMIAWAKVKPEHKHMRERLYQLNVPVILCCGAEKKIAMVLQTEGRNKGKTVPVDQGYMPICGSDIPWAMTISLMLEDVARPGVPRPIKALLPALKPIIHLDRPLDEATGAAIAAWARGEKTPAPNTEAGAVAGKDNMATIQQPPPDDQRHDDAPPPGDPRDEPPPPDPPPPDDERPPPATTSRKVDEAAIKDGAQKLADKFLGAEDRKAYLALVDDKENRKQIEWLRRNRRELFNTVIDRAMKATWQRTDPQKKQGDLV
jgi:hypothetical protein